MPVSLITPVGIHKQPEAMRKLVAASTTFQGIVGAANQTDAMEYALTYQAMEDYNQIPPMAVIDGDNLKRTNYGVGNWKTEGNLEIAFYLTDDLPQNATEYEDSKIRFTNNLANIWSDIEDLELHPFATGFVLRNSRHVD